MLELITNDPKTVYPEFKAFKPISVPLNFASYIVFDGRESKEGKNIKLFFSRDNDFYIIFGEISMSTKLGNWLSGKVAKIETSTISKIGKTLKKNVISISYDDDCFTFSSFEGGEQIFYKFENSKIYPESGNIENILNKCCKPIILDRKYLVDDVLELYLNFENQITSESSQNKILLEVPTAKLNALLKDTHDTKTECYLSYSDVIDDAFRYVCFSSYNSELQLRLSQLFLTV